MSFPLDKFESHISTEILKRGEQIWENRSFDDDIYEENGEYEAVVYGSDDYEVNIEINDDGMVEEYFCDCPYDWGPICKHIVAILFAIRDDYESKKKEIARTVKLGEKPEKKPVEAIIEKLDEAELRKLVAYFVRKDNSAKVHLLTNYTNLIKNVEKDHYKKLVESLVKAHTSGRYGMIEYADASRLGDKLYSLIDETSKQLLYQDEMQVVYLCEEVINQMRSAFENADDSSGGLGMAMEEAISRLDDLAEKDNETDKKTVQYIYDFALKNSQHTGGDWTENLRWLAITAARSKEQIQAIIFELERIINKGKIDSSGFSVCYEAEAAAWKKLEILKEWFSETEAEAFLQNNLQYSRFRKVALEQAIKKEEFIKALKIAEDGIEYDTNQKLPGLVNQWKEWKRKIVTELGDTKTLSEMTENMFLESRNMDYYRELKSQLSPEEFEHKVELFLEKFKTKSTNRPLYWRPSFNHSVANILIEEHRWPTLMKMVEKEPSLNVLQKYQRHLAGLYREPFLVMYDRCVRDYMDQNTGRNHYEAAVEYLKIMQKLKGHDRVEEIVKDWREMYPRRRAMIEVLKDF